MTVLTDRMTSLEVGLDDLQSGIEAGSRAATSLRDTAVTLDHMVSAQLKAADLAGSLVHRAENLRACLKDQRAALREMRHNLALLRVEMQALRQR